MGDGGRFDWEERYELMANIPDALEFDRVKMIEEVLRSVLARVPESVLRHAQKARISIAVDSRQGRKEYS